MKILTIILQFFALTCLGQGMMLHSYIRFDKDAAKVYNYADGQGITKPSESQLKALSDMVIELKEVGADGYSNLDLMYIADQDGSEAFASINWITPGSFTLTENGTVDWASNTGWTSNSTSDFMDAGWGTSTDAVNYALNDAMFLFVTNSINITSGNQYLPVAHSASSNELFRAIGGNGPNETMDTGLNTTTDTGNSLDTDTRGTRENYIVNKTAANAYNVYQNPSGASPTAIFTSSSSNSTLNANHLRVSAITSGTGAEIDVKLFINGGGISSGQDISDFSTAIDNYYTNR